LANAGPADRALPCEVLQSHREFVLGSVGVLFRFVPIVEVDVPDFLTVEDEGELDIVARDGEAVSNFAISSQEFRDLPSNRGDLNSTTNQATKR
jgi:hypothetical protein